MTEEPQEAEAPPEPMLEFKFPPTPNGQVDARTYVRWCTHKPLLEPLEERRFKDPRLLIVVRGPRELQDGGYSDSEWEDTAVYCVPLTAEMHYVYFHRPGINEIRAVVIDYAHKETRKWARRMQEIPRERLSGVKRFGFRSLFSETSRFNTQSDADIRYFPTDVVEKVQVPAELFAHEPPAWRKKFVAVYYGGKPYDECDFRRQTIGSVFMALFYSTIGLGLRIALLIVGLYLGLRGINFRAMLKPWKPRPIDVLEDSDDPLWICDEKGFLRFSPLNFVNPVVLTVLPAIVFGIACINRGKSPHRTNTWNISWWGCVAWVDGFIVGIVAFVVLVFLLIMAVAWLFGVAANSRYLGNSKPAKLIGAKLTAFSEFRERQNEQRRKDRATREQERRQHLQAEVAAMTCRLEASDVSIAALPKEKQTVKLRASQLKVNFCKPFAR